jgi:hypothetical protein
LRFNHTATPQTTGAIDAQLDQLLANTSVRPTSLAPGATWQRRRRAGLLAPLVASALDGDALREERDRAFDLVAVACWCWTCLWMYCCCVGRGCGYIDIDIVICYCYSLSFVVCLVGRVDEIRRAATLRHNGARRARIDTLLRSIGFPHRYSRQRRMCSILFLSTNNANIDSESFAIFFQNPIEKCEASAAIVASLLHNVAPTAVLAPTHAARIAAVAPRLADAK